LEKYPHELSGGQRQRVVLACAQIPNPKLLICDERISVLDMSIQARIINLLQELRRETGLTPMFINHGRSVVCHLCDPVAVMSLGQIVEQGPCAQIFDALQHPYTRALSSAIPVPTPGGAKQRIMLEGEPPSPLDPPTGGRFNPRCAKARDRRRTESPQMRSVGDQHIVACFEAGQPVARPQPAGLETVR
jgi:oligopeptide/dipeptide ABC transporter ATP-binding protein